MDFTLRNVPEEIVSEIDRRAAIQGISRQIYLHTFLSVHFSQSTARPEGALARELWDNRANSTLLEEILEDTSHVSRAKLVEYVLASRAALADLVSTSE